jgi:hypothetical protein
MNIKRIIPQIAIVCAIVVGSAVPVVASAHDRVDYRYREHRDDQWKGLSIASGIVGLAGLLGHDKTVAAIGIGSSIYFALRAEPPRRCAPSYIEHVRYIPMVVERHRYATHVVWRSRHRVG